MLKDLFKAKKPKTWDEAFRALTPAMRQHSVRVADYTQVLFEAVCKSSIYVNNKNLPVYMSSPYVEIAYKCGFFHQIGKALKPENYPVWNDNWSDEEKSAYCEYTTEGRKLVTHLQDEDEANVSIASKMIREACEQHMEHWDGTGWPYGCAGEEISLIAQIVGLAKELDRLVSERKSENPFNEAVDTLLAEENKMFSADLMDVFRSCRSDLKAIYKKYIQYTRIMPKTVPLIEKRPDRPFGLNYRQIVAGKTMDSFIFEAVPWFGAVKDKPQETESVELVEELLERAGLTEDISLYFMYEAADLLVRMRNCELRTGGVLLPGFSGFYSGEDITEQLKQFYQDTGIDPKGLMLTIPERLLKEKPQIAERLSSYIAQGLVLVVEEYHPDDIPIELLLEIGIRHVRMSESLLGAELHKGIIQELNNQGIMVIDRPSGDTCLSEDELIRYLMRYE